MIFSPGIPKVNESAPLTSKIAAHSCQFPGEFAKENSMDPGFRETILEVDFRHFGMCGSGGLSCTNGPPRFVSLAIARECPARFPLFLAEAVFKWNQSCIVAKRATQLRSLNDYLLMLADDARVRAKHELGAWSEGRPSGRPPCAPRNFQSEPRRPSWVQCGYVSSVCMCPVCVCV